MVYVFLVCVFLVNVLHWLPSYATCSNLHIHIYWIIWLKLTEYHSVNCKGQTTFVFCCPLSHFRTIRWLPNSSSANSNANATEHAIPCPWTLLCKETIWISMQILRFMTGLCRARAISNIIQYTKIESLAIVVCKLNFSCSTRFFGALVASCLTNGSVNLNKEHYMTILAWLDAEIHLCMHIGHVDHSVAIWLPCVDLWFWLVATGLQPTDYHRIPISVKLHSYQWYISRLQRFEILTTGLLYAQTRIPCN